jgi:hypothetical protein
MASHITVNGVEYASVDQMPPDVRQQYERAMSILADRDNNGVPDIIEGGNVSVTNDGKGNVTMSSVVTTSTTYDINGKRYERWEDVPAELRDAGVGDRPVAAGRKPGLSIRGELNFVDRIYRDPEVRRRRAISKVIASAILLVIAWIVLWLLKK